MLEDDMKKLPLGIQNFNKIINENCVYIDKTQYIYNLINLASYYFLSRPRRFGKSLLLDTINEVFRGNKELFKDLWIYNSGYAFPTHPVIRIDFAGISSKSPEILEESITSVLRKYYISEALEISDNYISDIFVTLIRQLYDKYQTGVVVLIDEYDKPILDHINNTEIADANRQVLRSLYGVLKSLDSFLKFTFVTGVSKFTKASIFSELNNLLDITLMDDFANICGVTMDDLDFYFDPYIKSLEDLKHFKNIKSIKNEILTWYDGYSWDGNTRVINPFSLLNFFIQKKFMNYWYKSGNPKFLFDLIKSKPESYLTLENLKLDECLFDVFEIHNLEIEPILFQTGYLTIKEILYEKISPVYLLEIPNFEVKDSFNLQVLAALTNSGDVIARNAQSEIINALKTGQLAQLVNVLKRLFASIPYEIHVKKEAYYHSIFYALMKILGFDMDVEVSVSSGRVDAVIELENNIYIFELKYIDTPIDACEDSKTKQIDNTLDDALEQIESKGYINKFINTDKDITCVALVFFDRDDIEMRLRKVE